MDLRAVVDAILYLLRTGCQWRMLPADFPPWGTVWWYFRLWRWEGTRVRLHRALFREARLARRQNPESALVIIDSQMDSQKVEDRRKGAHGFDGHKRVKEHKRQILVDANGLLVACRVEPAGVSDRRAARALAGGLAPLWPRIQTAIADAGDVCGALARHLAEHEGWTLRVVKRPRRASRS